MLRNPGSGVFIPKGRLTNSLQTLFGMARMLHAASDQEVMMRPPILVWQTRAAILAVNDCSVKAKFAGNGPCQ